MNLVKVLCDECKEFSTRYLCIVKDYQYCDTCFLKHPVTKYTNVYIINLLPEIKVKSIQRRFI